MEPLTLYSVEVKGSALRPVLSITLDKRGGVSMQDCSLLHKRILHDLADTNILQHATLEVSSCGLTRVLKHDWEIAKNTGKFAAFSLRTPIEGAYTLTGHILATGEACVHIEAGGVKYTLPLADIKKIKLAIEDKRV